MKNISLAVLLAVFLSTNSNAAIKQGDFVITGALGAATISMLGPVTTVMFKLGAGGEYWFSQNLGLGLDIGLGSEGYGKVIGTTSNSLVNLKTGSFILDPGLKIIGALNDLKHFKPYLSLRLGFPIRSGYPGAISLDPALGTLIAINESVYLDLGFSASVVATFKFNYLATILSFGSVGIKVII